MTLFRKDIAGGAAIPAGHGIAWIQYHRDAAVCYPIPFNVIAGWLRDFWLDVRAPKHLRAALWQEGEQYAAFRRGYEAGSARVGRQ